MPNADGPNAENKLNQTVNDGVARVTFDLDLHLEHTLDAC